MEVLVKVKMYKRTCSSAVWLSGEKALKRIYCVLLQRLSIMKSVYSCLRMGRRGHGSENHASELPL